MKHNFANKQMINGTTHRKFQNIHGNSDDLFIKQHNNFFVLAENNLLPVFLSGPDLLTFDYIQIST